MLREQEAGSPTGDVCRKHGISSATFYKWKAKFGGLDVSDAKRLKALEEENAKLKKLTWATFQQTQGQVPRAPQSNKCPGAPICQAETLITLGRPPATYECVCQSPRSW